MAKLGARRKGGRDQLATAIDGHHAAIEEAIRSGNMDEVKRVNELGFKNEMKEVRKYARMKNGKDS